MPTYLEPDLDDVFVGLTEMQKSILYIARKGLLAKAEQVIRTQLRELNDAVLENEKLKSQLAAALNTKFGPTGFNLKGVTRQNKPEEPNHYTFSMNQQPDQRAEPVQAYISSQINNIGTGPNRS